MSREEILKGLEIIHSHDQATEIRFFPHKGYGKATSSGYYDDLRKCAEDIEKMDGTKGIPAIYATLNPVKRAALARSNNRITQGAAVTTTETMITGRMWLPFDVDPVRPAKTSATDEGHSKSLDKAHDVRDWLTFRGFPMPVVADSGNGSHLLYKIDEPNSPEAKELIGAVQMAVISALNAPDKDGIDIQGFADGNRIFKVYGTKTQIGDEIPEMGIFHRRSKLLEVPNSIKTVTTDLLRSVAALNATEPAKTTTETPHANKEKPNKDIFDIVGWMDQHNIPVTRTKKENDCTYYILETCPLIPDHTGSKEAVIMQWGNGKLGFKCHHGSCDGKGWTDVREKYEPGYKEKKKNYTKKREGKDIAQPEIYSDETMELANMLLDNGDPFNFILDTWNEKHIGDKLIGQTALLSLACSNILNTKGIHPKPSGKSGAGKSDALTSMLFLVPGNRYLIGSLSGKSLFYDEDLVPGCIICNDDQKLNEDLIDTIKQSTSKYQDRTEHRTVKKQEKAVFSIPERVTFWLAGVDGLDDEQMGNRFINVDVDESEEQDERVYQRQVDEEYSTSNDDDVTDRVLVCRAIFDLIGADTKNIKVPFTDSIEWYNKENRRNFPMFKDMIRSVALFKYRQREQYGNVIIATVEDFNNTKKIYQQLGEKNATNLTENELKIMRYMEATGEAELKHIGKYMDCSDTTARNYLHGRDKNVDGGLLAKVPGLHMEQVSTSIKEDDDTTKNTRRNIYMCETKKFNLDSYGDVVVIDEAKAEEEYSRAVVALTPLTPETPQKHPTLTFKKTEKPLLRDLIKKNIDNNRIMTGNSTHTSHNTPNIHSLSYNSLKSEKEPIDAETGVCEGCESGVRGVTDSGDISEPEAEEPEKEESKLCLICGAPGVYEITRTVGRNGQMKEWRCIECYGKYSNGQEART